MSKPMGRISRIAKAVMRELHFERTTTVEIPVPTSDVSFEGRLAFITGGTSGIGLEIARALLTRGCAVVIVGRSEKKIDSALEDLASENARGIELDVREVNSMEKRVEEAAALFPNYRGIDTLVNAAGIMKCPHIDDVDQELWDSIMETNLRAPFFMSRAIAHHMSSRGIHGHILNVSSSASARNAKGPYEICKWALNGMTLGLAEQLIRDGIVVNAVAPGPTATPMLGMRRDGNLTNLANPSGRYADPREIANLACLLLSTYADLVVGQTVYTSGGAGTICIDK